MASKRNRTPSRQAHKPAQAPVQPIEDLLADVENDQVPPGLDVEGEEAVCR